MRKILLLVLMIAAFVATLVAAVFQGLTRALKIAVVATFALPAVAVPWLDRHGGLRQSRFGTVHLATKTHQPTYESGAHTNKRYLLQLWRRFGYTLVAFGRPISGMRNAPQIGWQRTAFADSS